MNQQTAQTTENGTGAGGRVDPLVCCDFFDKHGTQLRELDVVKVFHFIGARRKHHYMYKWLRRNGKGELCMKHLDEDDARLVPLVAVTETVDDRKVWATAEIVQTAYS